MKDWVIATVQMGPNAPGTSTVYSGYVVGFEISEGSTTYRCLPREKKKHSLL